MKYAIYGETIILEKNISDTLRLLENECNIIIVNYDKVYHKITPCNKKLNILYDFNEKTARIISWGDIVKELSMHKLNAIIIDEKELESNKPLLEIMRGYPSIRKRILGKSYEPIMSTRERIIYPKIRLLMEDKTKIEKLVKTPIIYINGVSVAIDYGKQLNVLIALPRRTLSLYLSPSIPAELFSRYNIRYVLRKKYLRIYEYDVFKIILLILTERLLVNVF